jgi:hypothetical protein
MMARPETTLGDRFSIVTPEKWVRIDLDPRTRDRSIRAMVKRGLGADDKLARLRQEAIVAYRTFVADAADKGAFLALMVSEIIEDTPMFATMLAFVVPTVTGPDDAVLSTVEEMAPVLDEPGEGERVLETGPFELGVGPAYRVRALVGSGMHGSDGVEAVADVVRFFVPLAGEPHVLVLTFSTPILGLGDTFAELFDQMARSARWLPAPAGGG